MPSAPARAIAFSTATNSHQRLRTVAFESIIAAALRLANNLSPCRSSASRRDGLTGSDAGTAT
mgnify:CR=1 FL=1